MPTKNRPLAYIVVVLLVSWVVQSVLFSGRLPESLMALYMFTPAAIALVFFFFNKNPWREQAGLFARGTGVWSWVFALGYPLCWFSVAVAAALLTGLGRFNPSFLPLLFSWPFLAGFAVSLLAILPSIFGEEYGWRGYLLPALADKYGKVRATFILGAVWGLWHIPSYYIAYSKAGLGDPILLTALGVVAVAVGAFPYTYLFYLKRNILPAILMHAVYDLAAGQIFFGTPAVGGLTGGVTGLLIIQWPFVLGLLIATGSISAYFFVRKIR